jgi:two-component system response regulator FlrC
MTTTVLVVEDDQSLRDALGMTLELGGFQVHGAADGYAALDVLAEHEIDLVVSDVQMRKMDGHTLLRQIKAQRADLPVLMMTAYGTIQNAVQAMHDGAADYLVKPFEAEVLVAKVSELLGARGAARKDDAEGIVTADPRMQEVMSVARRVAASDATVLIMGESGVGKEVMFRYVHRHSRRADMPSVAINCAAIPENMLEAILFCYEKGAFTGAYKSCPGKFEQAQGGSLLLDEISEMSLPLQAKLLRVLQERQVERLGSNKLTDLDVRVLATTNRDLRAEVAAGRFREDLFYRLNVFPLRIPALRERPGDIVPLAECFLARAAAAAGTTAPKLTDAAREFLVEQRWSGNVRELDNVIQRACIIHEGNLIQPQDLHVEAAICASATAPAEPSGQDEAAEGLSGDLKERERQLILDALDEGRGSRKYAAEKLGISPRTLRYKLARMREQGEAVPAR